MYSKVIPQVVAYIGLECMKIVPLRPVRAEVCLPVSLRIHSHYCLPRKKGVCMIRG